MFLKRKYLVVLAHCTLLLFVFSFFPPIMANADNSELKRTFYNYYQNTLIENYEKNHPEHQLSEKQLKKLVHTKALALAREKYKERVILEQEQNLKNSSQMPVEQKKGVKIGAIAGAAVGLGLGALLGTLGGLPLIICMSAFGGIMCANFGIQMGNWIGKIIGQRNWEKREKAKRIDYENSIQKLREQTDLEPDSEYTGQAGDDGISEDNVPQIEVNSDKNLNTVREARAALEKAQAEYREAAKSGNMKLMNEKLRLLQEAQKRYQEALQ
ncbi:hypothetical protein ACFL35_05720 [Candidatus Riflebacteria bacterium]